MIACHECDLLVREPALPPGGRAFCPRCGAVAGKRSKGISLKLSGMYWKNRALTVQTLIR